MYQCVVSVFEDSDLCFHDLFSSCYLFQKQLFVHLLFLVLQAVTAQFFSLLLQFVCLNQQQSAHCSENLAMKQ